MAESEEQQTVADMNRDNPLLATLVTEQDILDRIVTALDTRTLRSLETTCRKSRAIFRQFYVWERLVGRWSAETGIVCDWARRMNLEDYQQILSNLENLERRWRTGPFRSRSNFIQETVVDTAMDEASIVGAT